MNTRIHDGRIILAGHRGDRKHAPENTMPSFRSAVRLGVDMIETDVHMSKDGVMFLMHDDDVDRTTDGGGHTRDKTWAELQRLDAGSWFDPSFAGTRVPTLDEFLALVADTPNLWVNWELKDYPRDAGLQFALKSVEGLLEGIRRYHLEQRSMLNSFSTEVLEYACRACDHAMPIHGQGVAPTDRMHGPVAMPIERYWDWACMYGGSKPIDIEEAYANCRALHIRPCVCVPDTMENYRLAIERGCRMFTSDDPETADRLLCSLGER